MQQQENDNEKLIMVFVDTSEALERCWEADN